MKQLGLLIRLIVGIIAGTLIGLCGGWFGIADSTAFIAVVRLFATFTSLFSTFLSFMIPLIILSFITVGMAELGKKAKTYMDQGLLVPDELTCDLVVDRIQQPDAANGYVLDGFPRTIPQAECLTEALNKLGSKVDYAIDVDVPDCNIVIRMSGRRACLKCGATYHVVHAAPKVEGVCDTCGEKLVLRDDDQPETVQKRLNVYHEQTQPLIDYYTKEGILKSVDGTKDLEEVFADIVAILGE